MISLQEELRYFKRETVNAYYNDALRLVKDNNISKAIELMERSLEEITEDIEILNLMGICQYMLCNFDKASLYWKQSLIANNGNNRARHYLGLLNTSKYRGFIEYYNLSINYIEKFQYRDAIELLLEINKTNRDLIEPYALIGNCYYALQEYELAKQYLEQALTRDIDNLKYLRYLNKIDTSTSSKWDKGKLKYTIMFSSIVLLIAIISITFYQKYNKDMKALSSELDKSKSEYAKLAEQLKDKKEKKEEKDKDEKKDKKEKDDLDSKVVEFDGSEDEIFEEAMKDFESKKYNESIDKFKYLMDKVDDDYLIGESIYFMAVTLEKEKNYDIAEKYYTTYIEKYNDRNYYDDALYNYGLMLHEKGDIKASKEILNKLKNEEPDSEFINSKVKSILEE